MQNETRKIFDFLRRNINHEGSALLHGLDLAQQSVEEMTLRHPAGELRELAEDLDADDLSQAGWGVLFPPARAQSLRHHLQPLLDRRRQQAGALYREPELRDQELARQFLWRHRAAPGNLDPKRMPYYLLLAGTPEEIPFEFQYQLAINHAVGRVAFDENQDYSEWARQLVETESQGPTGAPRGLLFSVDNGDRTGQLLSDHLVLPVEQQLATYDGAFPIEVWRDERSSKAALGRLLGGDATPQLLLTACHGLKATPGADDQERLQGALICRRPEPDSPAPDLPAEYFVADDLADDSGRLRGQIAFFFACYGAGTPLTDDFPVSSAETETEADDEPWQRRPLALRPFLAALPKALLARGAQAVVGHVDRGWTYSFAWSDGRQMYPASQTLIDSLKRLLKGQRLGHALRPIYRRYAALAAQLVRPLENLRYGETVDERILAMQWTAHHDARNFIILGDPASRLRLRQRSGSLR